MVALVENLITVALKALAEDGSKEPPKEFLIFPYGEIPTEKGTFKFTPEACDALLAERARHSARVMIDYDHLAVKKDQRPGDGKAAGWCNLEKRDDGLWAVNVNWTPAAQQMLRDGEYKYFSPYFAATKDEHLIVLLMNIAITNMPAMFEIDALVAASRFTVELAAPVPPTPPPAPPPAPAPTEQRTDGATNTPKARNAGSNILPKKKESRTMAHKLGGYLANHMKKNGLSAKAMADKSGLPEDRIRHLHDGGDPSPEEMNALATKGFGLTGPNELEEQIDSWNGDATTDDGDGAGAAGGDGAEMRTQTSTTSVTANRGRHQRPARPTRVENNDDAAAMLIGLTGEENLETAADTLYKVVQAARELPALHDELKKLRAQREQDARERVIRKGKDMGKLNPKLIRMLSREPVEKAEAMLDALPVLSVEQRSLRESEPSEAAAILTKEQLDLCHLTREPVANLAAHVQKNAGYVDQLGGDNADAILNSYREEATRA